MHKAVDWSTVSVINWPIKSVMHNLPAWFSKLVKQASQLKKKKKANRCYILVNSSSSYRSKLQHNWVQCTKIR